MDFILWLQGFSSPLLDRVFIEVTRLGSEAFYVALIPLVYWNVNRRVGIRLALLFLISIYVNFAIKDILRLPRPSGPGLRVVYPESGTGYGFPSGHAQGNATIWGYLYAAFRRPWLLALAVVVTGAVALSRLYLGLHYPADVLGGIAIGAALVVVFHAVVSRCEFVGFGTAPQVVAALVLPLAALALYHTDDSYRMAGAAIGLALGYIRQESKLRFEERAGPAGHLFKTLIGVAGLFVIYRGTHSLFPEGPAQVARYALIGLWAAYGAPLFFVTLGLSRRGRAAGLSHGGAG